MSGGPTQWRSGISTSLNSLTLQTDTSFTITASHNPPEADSATRSGVSVGGNSDPHPGITNLARFGAGPAYQRTIQNDVLHSPDHFDDAPYVPPRADATPHTEPPVYPGQGPQINDAYSARSQGMQQYPYESGTSPSDSNHSIASSWSTSSSSSTSSQRAPHDYFFETASQYSQSSLPPDLSRQAPIPQHYPAYHGHHRLGLEHVRYVEQPPSAAGGPFYRTTQTFPITGLLSSEIFDDPVNQVHSIPPHAGYASSQGASPASTSIHRSSRHSSMTMFSVSPNPPETNRSLFPDAGPYLRQQLGLAPNEPVGLNSLPDPPHGAKPATPLPMLIKLAIFSSPNKQLTLQEIYTCLENRFEWFRAHKNDKAWKNSIRHNLSLNKVFRHVPRPITEPGKGSYWQLDVSEGEGYKRPRKRRAKNRLMASEDDEDDDPSEDERASASASEYFQYAGPSRTQTAPIDDTNIDPELRGERGHVVGEGRTRSSTRRPGGAGTPYPSHYQPSQLPAVQPQETVTFSQPAVRFGQSSFGQPSFPSYGLTQGTTTPGLPGPSGPAFIATSAAPPPPQRSEMQRSMRIVTYQHHESVGQSTQRSGVEYPPPRRMNTYPPAHPESTAHNSDSSSSGSSQTWKGTRSRSQRSE